MQAEHTPRAVIVHGLEMARAALAAGPNVVLLSAEGAASYAGVGWWRALMLAANCPEPRHILDCGAAPGRALEALRAGQRRLVLRTDPRIYTDIAARGGEVLNEAPASLDLGKRGAHRILEKWVKEGLLF